MRRVWADGRELDLTGLELRVYRGDEHQLPDPQVEAKQGAGNAPAYRGLAYVVFERLPLDTFGNRIPLLQFEVLRPVGRLERQIRAVTIIPGATEHGYATAQVTEKTGEGSARIVNRNMLTAGTDWQASLDELTSLCPNLERVALVVTWFGTDLRAGHCRIVPGVEVPHRHEENAPWSVNGIARADAHVVSHHEGGPAYGGTPSDGSVLQAISDLKTRGLKVYLYPFLMMDIPPANGLPDPYGGAAQAGYPWRGRITCYPGPGQPASADRTAPARAQVEAFASGGEGYRRMVLHYAHLASEAGGVDGFLLGSELRDLSDGLSAPGDREMSASSDQGHERQVRPGDGRRTGPVFRGTVVCDTRRRSGWRKQAGHPGRQRGLGSARLRGGRGDCTGPLAAFDPAARPGWNRGRDDGWCRRRRVSRAAGRGGRGAWADGRGARPQPQLGRRGHVRIGWPYRTIRL